MTHFCLRLMMPGTKTLAVDTADGKLTLREDFCQNLRNFVPAKYLLSINRESLFARKNKSFRITKVRKSKNLNLYI